MLWLCRTCSNRNSITGREWASSSRWLAMMWRTSLWLLVPMSLKRPMGSSPAATLRCQERARRASTAPGGQLPFSMSC